jgi:hypothetical protein
MKSGCMNCVLCSQMIQLHISMKEQIWILKYRVKEQHEHLLTCILKIKEKNKYHLSFLTKSAQKYK